MATATSSDPIASPSEPRSLRDLIDDLGDVPLSRILAHPAPGTATETDMLEANRRLNRLYELVDGVLVEKVMGYQESLFALFIARLLLDFVEPRNLGLVSGADGTMRLLAGLVRIPDVAFTSWDRIPGRVVPTEPIPALTPDLVIEVVGKSNTPAEIERKQREYFTSGVKLLWEFDLESRAVTVLTPGGGISLLDASQRLDGGVVLPGLSIALSELFGKLDRRG